MFKFCARQKAGFTLIELLVVLALVALIFAVALPGFGVLSEKRSLELAARELCADLRLCRQKAITSGARQSIEFRIYGNDYRVKDSADQSTYKVKLPAGISYEAVNFPVSGGYPAVVFLKSGAPGQRGHL